MNFTLQINLRMYTYFRLHRVHELQTIATDDCGVCLSVSRGSTRLHCAKMAKRIKMLFGVNTPGRPRNRVLDGSTVPTVFKSALITPLIKKPDLDSADPRSYRPISNLSVVSKLLERVVFRQFYSYLSAADRLPRLAVCISDTSLY